jgi:hypothetical protein
MSLQLIKHCEESCDKEEVVLEPIGDEHLPPSSKNEECDKEEQIVPDPMDVDISDMDNVLASFEEGNFDEASVLISPEHNLLTDHQVKEIPLLF